MYLTLLKPKGRLHFVGAVVQPIQFSLLPTIGKQRTISASRVGSPSVIAKMLEFAKLHWIYPQVETFALENVKPCRVSNLT